MRRYKAAESLQPGDELLKAPGEVVTVTQPTSVSGTKAVIHTDEGDWQGPRGLEIRVVAEGLGGN